MNHLIRSEWVKFRSVRSTVVTLLLGGAIVVLVAVLVALNADTGTTVTCEPVDPAVAATSTPQPELYCGDGFAQVVTPTVTHLTGLTAGVTFAALTFGTLGVQVIGSEYRFNTIRPTFTSAPRRVRVMVAKLVVVCLACAAVATIMVAFCWVVGTTMVDQFVVDDVDRRVAWGIVVFTALWTTAGVGVGAIVRQPIAGILLLAAEALIIEGLIGGIFPSAQEWLPFTNGLQMTLRLEDVSGNLQPLLQGGLYFAAVCVALFGVGTWLVQRRDA